MSESDDSGTPANVDFANPRGRADVKNPPDMVSIPFKMDMPPSLLAQFEIDQLAQRPDLRRLLIVGRGSLTPEQVIENERRESEFDRLRLEIIRKHGLEAEYLSPLIQKRHRLWIELVEVNKQIATFRA